MCRMALDIVVTVTDRRVGGNRESGALPGRLRRPLHATAELTPQLYAASHLRTSATGERLTVKAKRMISGTRIRTTKPASQETCRALPIVLGRGSPSGAIDAAGLLPAFVEIGVLTILTRD